MDRVVSRTVMQLRYSRVPLRLFGDIEHAATWLGAALVAAGAPPMSSEDLRRADEEVHAAAQSIRPIAVGF